MFSSFDKRFLIKTMNKKEQAVFMAALPTYLWHLKQNPKALIAKIFGIYTIRMEGVRQVHILLMDNLFLHVQNMVNQFDLKGSMVNRVVREPFVVKKSCLKDLNLLSLKRQDQFLRFQKGDMRTICK